jgi:hypothetical protein
MFVLFPNLFCVSDVLGGLERNDNYYSSNLSFVLPGDVNKLRLHVDCYIDSHTRDLAITPDEGCGVLIAPLMGMLTMLTAAPPSATAGVSKGTVFFRICYQAL